VDCSRGVFSTQSCITKSRPREASLGSGGTTTGMRDLSDRAFPEDLPVRIYPAVGLLKPQHGSKDLAPLGDRTLHPSDLDGIRIEVGDVCGGIDHHCLLAAPTLHADARGCPAILRNPPALTASDSEVVTTSRNLFNFRHDLLR
jgi:hypothetical protein